MRILAVANQKGGVGKTTVAVHLAGSLAMSGYRVLLVDADHQANATQALGVSSGPHATLSAWLPWGQGEPQIQSTAVEGLNVLPGFLTMADDEWEAIEGRVDPQSIAQRLRTRYTEDYDWVVLDTPPSLAFWARVALLTAQRVLVPLTPAPFPMVGFRQLMARIDWIRHHGWNPPLRLLGVVVNMVDPRTMYGRHARELAQGVVDAEYLFETVIPMASAVAQAQGQSRLVFDQHDRSAVAVAFIELLKEVLARWDGVRPKIY